VKVITSAAPDDCQYFHCYGTLTVPTTLLATFYTPASTQNLTRLTLTDH